MLKKAVFSKDRVLLYKECSIEASSFVRKRIFSSICDWVSERKSTNGSDGIQISILHRSRKQNSKSNFCQLLRNDNVLKESNAFCLNVNRRYLHNYFSLTSKNLGDVSYSRWKSTDADQNSQLDTMHGTSLNSEEMLKGVSPITSSTNKILNIDYKDNEETRRILSLYPLPKNVLHNYFVKFTNKMKQSIKLSKLAPVCKLLSDNPPTWLAYYHAYWPEEIKFSALDCKKHLASCKAAVAALNWLKSNGRITKEGLPVISKNEQKQKEITINKLNSVKEASKTLKSDPSPHDEIDKIFNELAEQNSDESVTLSANYKLMNYVHNKQYVCVYSFTWPEAIIFSAGGSTPLQAASNASASILMWLNDNKGNNRNVKMGNEDVNKQIVVEGENKDIRENVLVKEIYYEENENTRDILKLFPAPKNTLHNVFDIVSMQTETKSLKITPHYKLNKDSKPPMWMSVYHIRWPEEIKFIAEDAKKGIASHKAAIVALDWLRANGKINKLGVPQIYGKEEIKTITKKTVPVLSLDKSTIDKIRDIVQLHRTQIVPHIIQSRLEKAQNGDESGEDEEINSVIESNDMNLKTVKVQRYVGLERYLAKEKVKLPIAEYKDNFINILKNNQIIIVKGEPGCGKSTRIPQYVLEAWAREEGLLGEPGRIVVTQPRRIAAISLAERVASERDETVGSIVGYQVRLKSNFLPSTGRILYCTTGILLRHFQSDPNISKFTHVILDEAHERDVNTDLLMNLLRDACKKNPSLKLIVMSATIDTTMFSEYFDGAPVMEIPGFTYPVEQYFLDYDTKIDLNRTLTMCEGNVPTVIHEDVVRLIMDIHKNKKEGAILCFLPGWEDISKIQRLIPIRGDCAVYCLHSRLQDSDQWKIFSKAPPGVRKIILATNIAETSVTIDDVVYVIDTGIHKEQRFDIEKGVNVIDNHWISKASANQRKGRAGRVQPGESYHLYPREKYRTFPDYSIPEIQRTSLTKIVLDSKVSSNNMNAIEFMSKLLTRPEENTTLRAVEELKELEMLDKYENLTSLGKTCASFQLEPKLSKAMISAVIFKCVTPVVDIVTLFSADMEFFSSALVNRENVRKTKLSMCRDSDHLSMMLLFEKWLVYSEEKNWEALKRFCNQSNLVSAKMQTIAQLRTIHHNYLYDGLYDVMPISDDFSDNDEMVKAVLYSGVGTILQHRNWDIVKNKLKNNVNCLLTRNNHRATITTESVNHKRSKFPTNFLLYINETRSNIRRTTLIRECSLIPAISVLLFTNKDLQIKEIDGDDFSSEIDSQDQVKVCIENTNIELVCDRIQAQDLIACKDSIMAAYRYYIEQLTATGQQNVEVNTAWDDILALVGDILRQNRV